jgi:hypothetical protein
MRVERDRDLAGRTTSPGPVGTVGWVGKKPDCQLYIVPEPAVEFLSSVSGPGSQVDLDWRCPDHQVRTQRGIARQHAGLLVAQLGQDWLQLLPSGHDNQAIGGLPDARISIKRRTVN